MTDFILHNGSGRLCCKSCGRQDRQLNTYDWLADIPGNDTASEYVEVQFKNTRKGYFRNSNHLELTKGDTVAVEANPGHDIGVVTLTGQLVPLQMKKANIRSEADIRRIYRKAKPTDMEKYAEAKAREHDTMIRSRQIALSLGLDMKIGDVEYQGDGNKAIFYYIAEGRVDFRQLIKVLAEVFRVRIEMKQIGARQEAGRIGGIGPCGRELCCATWMTSFVSVSTGAARFQDISLNPQKLAGQCAKLKCCLNYEVDCYVEVTYSSDKSIPANLTTISARRAFEIIGMNKRGNAPEKLIESENDVKAPSADLLEQESVTRFDRNRKGKGAEGGKSGNGKKKKKAKGAQSANAENGDKPANKNEKTDKPAANTTKPTADKQSAPQKAPKAEKGEKTEKPEVTDKGEKKEKGGNGQNRNRRNRPKQEKRERPQQEGGKESNKQTNKDGGNQPAS